MTRERFWHQEHSERLREELVSKRLPGVEAGHRGVGDRRKAGGDIEFGNRSQLLGKAGRDLGRDLGSMLVVFGSVWTLMS